MRLRAFVADSAARDDIRTTLRAAPDMSRALARLSVGRGGPRDLAGLRDGILAADQALARLAQLEAPPPEIAAVMEALRRPSRDLAREFERALAEQLPLIKRDGGFVRESYEPALDESRNLRDASRLVVAAMQARYADDTGIKGLKIRHNNVLGYFVEVTAQHGDKLMAPPLERDLHPSPDAGRARSASPPPNSARSRPRSPMPATARSDLELEIFERLCAMALAASDDLRAAAHAFALLDVATALAKLAVDDNYVRPEVDGSLGFAVEGGRHPVVEQALKRDGQPFIANACDLSPGPAQKSGQIWLITGPNMAGKSTFLRQNALIALLAQIGSLRAGDARADRRRRPAVLARRRRRRSRARPLHLHGRDGRDRGRSSTRPANARWSSSMRSAAAPRPSTACRSPGPRSSICMRPTAAARCSPRIIMS